MPHGFEQRISPGPLRRLTTRTNALALGLEHGAAELLRWWWFGEDMVAARSRLNFHARQKQAILNAIVAHKVLGAATLLALYQHVAPDALLAGNRLAEVSAAKHAHPKYCFKMATGTGKTWVLQALLIWQLLNKNAALAEGRDDARFTRLFMVVTPGLIAYERLLDAFCGKLVADTSSRDFSTSDVFKFADLFMPEEHRDAVCAFIHDNRHTFARLRYVKEDGLPAFYSPDFLVRTADAVYLAETKAQQQTAHPNVQRKRKAALAWCERINALPPEQRGGPPWHYVLLAENVVYEWQAKGERLAELLDYARLRPLANASLQTSLI